MKVIYYCLAIQLVILATSLKYVNCQKNGCNSTGEDRLDTEVQNLYMFGSLDRPYPINDGEMNNWCRETRQSYDFIKSYGDKCLQRLSKQLTSLMTYSVAKYANGLCRSKRQKREFWHMGRCGNAAKSDTKKCWTDLIQIADGVSTIKNQKMKIPLLCCQFTRFKLCNLESYERQSKVCDKKAIDGLDKLLNVYAIDLMRVFCGEYGNEASDVCDKIGIRIPKIASKKLPKSPISTVVKIFDSLPDE